MRSSRTAGVAEKPPAPSVNGTQVGPVSVLPDELARFRQDATLALLDVRSTELHRAGGIEEPAVARFQDGAGEST